MNILQKFIQKGKNSDITIGIGLSELPKLNRNIGEALIQFFQSYKNTIILYGSKQFENSFPKNNILTKRKSNLVFKASNEPEVKILEDLESNNINAAIRGSLSSSLFIKYIKKHFNVLETSRLALLETYAKDQFFFGPVGIDECNTSQKKILFIESALSQFTNLRIPPRISILSGGRISDIGR
ncbi:MAG: hypothetical protein ACFFKA_02025, partial [Candidatus Thorarchaeota archaeon]